MTSIWHFKSLTTLVLLPALLALTSCGGALSTLAKTEADITAGCTTAYTVVAQGNASGLISTQDATTIMNALLQIELANKQAITATTAINTLNTTNSANLLAIITPVQTALNNLISSGLVGIKDPTTQASVKLTLTTINTAITVAVSILQAVK